MSVSAIIGTIALAGVGGYVGFFAGMVLCPDPGDIGIGAMPWCIGGAIIGAVAGGVAGMVVFG